MTTIVLIFPAIVRTAGDHEFAPLPFANRSGFPKTTHLVKSADLTAHPVVNLSKFGHVRLTTGDDIDIIPATWSNVSLFPDGTELEESGPDVNLRPATWSNASVFPSGNELDEAPADVNLRPEPLVNVSTFGSPTLFADEGGGGGGSDTDGDDSMIAGDVIGGTTI